ncbi:MAG: hypothetical protein ACRDSZ_13160 [Pseudonocardiaceae bacterium]
MTAPEDTPQETELDPESSADETIVDVNPETAEKGAQEAAEKGLTADYQIEGEKAAAADYQTRLEAFDNVETPVSVVSLPVETPSSEESDEA